MSDQAYFSQLLVIIGIIFQIMGFVWMNYRWNRLPELVDYENWKKINEFKHPDWFNDEGDWAWMDFVNVTGNGNDRIKDFRYNKRPKQFKNKVRNERKIAPLLFVTIGSGFELLAAIMYFEILLI